MSWARIDDKLHSHPKIKAIVKRTDPIGAWTRMLSWSCDYRTRGRIPRSTALDFATQSTIDKLVEVGLLDVAEHDYVIHDFEEYNPSGPATDTARAAASEKKREAGKKGAAKRWGKSDDTANDGRTDGTVPSDANGTVPSKTDGKPIAPDSPTRGRAPDPSPSPSPLPEDNNKACPWSVDWCIGELRAAAADDPIFDGEDLSEADRTFATLARKLNALAPEHRFVDLRTEVATWFVHARGRAAEASDRHQPWGLARTLTEVESKATFRLMHRPKDARIERDRARQERDREQRSSRFERKDDDDDLDLDDESLFPRTMQRGPGA